MFSNCGDSEDSWEYLGLQGDQISQSWTDVEAPVLCHLLWRADSLEKILMLEKIEGRGRRGTAVDEMVGLNHWLNGYESEQSHEDSEGQGSLLACCTVVHEVTKSQIWPSDWTTTEILKESQMTVFDYNKMMTFWFVKDSNHVIKERLAHYKNISVIYIIYTFYWLEYEKNCKVHKKMRKFNYEMGN